MRQILFIKLALCFKKKTGYSQPLHIHVEKKIPIKGGLGGGSSNAATTLWAINKLSKLNIDEKELQKWAGQISSDSPFFFSKGTAFSTGRGEQIENREFKKATEKRVQYLENEVLPPILDFLKGEVLK